MSWPTGLAAWLRLLRRSRRRSAADQGLLNALADIQTRATDLWSALDAARLQRQPHVMLSYELVREATAAIDDAIAAWVRPTDLPVVLLEERVALTRTLRGLQRELFRLRFLAGLFTSRLTPSADLQRLLVAGVRTYRVRSGDTLATIAAGELGSRDRWTELVALNDLTWPYTGSRADYPTSRIVEPGESLLLPMPDATSAVTGGLPPTQDDLYGIDLDISHPPGQIHFERGDVALVAGVDNVAQAVRLRALTPRGALALHPDYGSHVFRWIGQEGSDEVRRLALFDYMRAVLEDPRVTGVNRRSASLDGQLLRLTLDLTVIGIEKPVRVNAIIPAIGG